MIPHYLDRLTTYLFHEVVHKIGFINSNGGKQLPDRIKEAGTELVTAEALKTKDCKGYLFSENWAKFPNTISTYFLDCVMINQINNIVGNSSLEKSILNGNCQFLEDLENKFGKEKSDELIESFTNMSERFDYFTTFFKVLNEKEKEICTKEINHEIDEIQGITLQYFNEKLNETFTTRQANDLLDSLLDYSNYRIKKQKDGSFHDDEFEKCFKETKQKLKERFPEYTFSQSYHPNSWGKDLEEYKEVVQIPKEEKSEILSKGKKEIKSFRKEKVLGLFGIKLKKEELEK